MVERTLAEVEKKIKVRRHYDNFIGGEWVPPVKGQKFENVSPIDGSVVCTIARSTAEDIELCARCRPRRQGWLGPRLTGRARARSQQDRRPDGGKARILAPVEAIDNGKPIRETKAADLPLAIDHFRYFAGCIRAQEGSLSEIDDDTVAYHFHEPLGVVGQISHGTSRCSWRCGSSRRPWPLGTAWC